jgi:BMFP domain-containing protein YqiC
MATMELTQIYLQPAQKKALQARAKIRGTKLAEEVRQAVETYLAGVTQDELTLLDYTTREAQKHLDAMARKLDATNRKLDNVFAQMHKLRSGGRKRAW